MTLRNRHRRADDHTTPQPLSSLSLETDIVGRYPTLPTYPAGMLVADVLADLIARLGVVGAVRGFTGDAVVKAVRQWAGVGGSIPYAFTCEADVRRSTASSFSANAKVV